MMLANKSDYAIHAMMYIAAVDGKHLCTITEIAKESHIPREYAAKILKELTRRGLITSKRGVTGGYKLAKSKSQINFLQIVETMEGPLAVALCNVPESQRSGMHKKGACAATAFFKNLQEKIANDLSGMTLDKLDYAKFYNI
ncbi:MAG: Rrf2 family transcriptional regulator [candidate division Zixibacteria bacterium]|jgi:Rrf2 family protein|nr:Rrf2 family transcriptional regulator [candidate division Zixibacteria bacterium]